MARLLLIINLVDLLIFTAYLCVTSLDGIENGKCNMTFPILLVFLHRLIQ